ncbi:MAG: 3TM-type holin [bacterium]
MDLAKIVDDLGTAIQDVETRNGPLPEYRPATAQGRTGYNLLIDAMNRLPRPLMALLTIAAFLIAGCNPPWFEARMQALAMVPPPMWWIIGAVITFFFGARETHYLRENTPPKP